MSQADLFAAPLIDGLDYDDELITPAEHDQLVLRLAAIDLRPFRFHGWTGNRKTETYGWRYDFTDASFTPAEPIPDWLLPLRVKAAAFAGVEAGDFAHVLLARYDPGAGIGWHRDRPQFETVVGVSLYSATRMRFRQRTPDGFRRANIHLAPRSAYVLTAAARWEWEHSIAAGETLRFSITFRTLSEQGRQRAAQHL
ncbi:MAG TPA: alpha-ketoglutarate-dependent dioxygenase AlkB [Sphingomicrobium sp.]|nr:alpha-ketoglutarate-dependent dioxygenase AlkB [Sphingomicrobium sp.]